MLTGLKIKNFKCFEDETSFTFGQFNLLTGANGAGKSSVLQPLLLMRQSIDRNPATNKIFFNGSAVELGTFQYVRNANTHASEPILLTFEFGLDETTCILSYTLISLFGEMMAAHIEYLSIDAAVQGEPFEFRIVDQTEILGPTESGTPTKKSTEIPRWDHLLLIPFTDKEHRSEAVQGAANFRRVHFVSADRLGPQDHYSKQSIDDFVHVGSRGEHVGSVLYFRKDDIVNDALCIGREEKVPETLLDQTEAWLARIFGHARIHVQDTSANIILLELGTDAARHRYRPKNVGFGYSTALPIVVSCLIAQPGDILIVENPEAHLHPAAQSLLMKLLLRVSNLGVQVFVESHSDHVLNSTRVAVKNGDIPSDAACVYYFSRQGDEPIKKLAINGDGSVDAWPYGFFDQTDRDQYELYGV